jgi:hypothetical protein
MEILPQDEFPKHSEALDDDRRKCKAALWPCIPIVRRATALFGNKKKSSVFCLLRSSIRSGLYVRTGGKIETSRKYSIRGTFGFHDHGQPGSRI